MPEVAKALACWYCDGPADREWLTKIGFVPVCWSCIGYGPAPDQAQRAGGSGR